MKCDHSLVNRFGCGPINGPAIIQTHGYFALSCEIDDFLNLRAGKVFCYKKSFERPAGSQGFPYRMDSDKNCHYNE